MGVKRGWVKLYEEKKKDGWMDGIWRYKLLSEAVHTLPGRYSFAVGSM
jgi:hypothetical protein